MAEESQMRAAVTFLRPLAFALSLLALSPVATAQTPGALAPTQRADGPLALGIPIRTVMNGIIDFWTFGVLWLATSNEALDDDDWRTLSLASLNLTIAATAITAPGAGPNDAAWVADPDWRKWATEMQSAAVMLERAAEGRDRQALSAAGNRLADACLSCHTQFKPRSPPRSSLAGGLAADDAAE
jgi:hypothetical protein